MANVVNALAQLSRYQQESAIRGVNQLADFMKEKRSQKLVQDFIRQGDFSPEGIKRFGESNKLDDRSLGQIIQTTQTFKEFKRQREQDALKKQYYQDDLKLQQEKLNYDKSRLQQNDLAAQQKAQQQQERDVRKTLSGQYELIRKSIVGNDSADFMLDYDENGNPVASQGDFDKLLNIRNSGGPKANQAAKALNIYSRLTGIEIPPPPEPEKEYSLMDSFNRGVDQGLENVRTGQVEGAGGGQLTSDIAAQYLQKAGGDRAKAEKMAKADGFTW